MEERRSKSNPYFTPLKKKNKSQVDQLYKYRKQNFITLRGKKKKGASLHGIKYEREFFNETHK